MRPAFAVFLFLFFFLFFFSSFFFLLLLLLFFLLLLPLLLLLLLLLLLPIFLFLLILIISLLILLASFFCFYLLLILLLLYSSASSVFFFVFFLFFFLFLLLVFLFLLLLLQQAASFKQRNARSNRSKKSTKQEKHYSYSRILEATETEKPQSKQKRRARKQPGINQETLQKMSANGKIPRKRCCSLFQQRMRALLQSSPSKRTGRWQVLQVLHETRYKQWNSMVPNMFPDCTCVVCKFLESLDWTSRELNRWPHKVKPSNHIKNYMFPNGPHETDLKWGTPLFRGDHAAR